MPPNRSRSSSRQSRGSSSSDDGRPVNNFRYGNRIGFVLADVLGEFLGSCPVKEASGQHIADEGTKRIKDLKQPKRSTWFVVSPNGVYIIDADTKELIKETPISDVSFVALDAKSKGAFSFIARNAALGLITLHSFKAKASEVAEVPLAINEAFMIKSGKLPVPDPHKRRRKRSMTEARDEAAAAADAGVNRDRRGSKGKDVVDPSFIGAFEARYVCSLAVTESRGVHVAEEVLAVASEIGLPEGKGCIIVVSSEGLRTLDALTQEQIFQTVIKEVKFTTIVGNKSQIFSYISESEMTGRILCHLFNKGTADSATELATAVGAAFAQAHKEAIENANPFLVKAKDKGNRERAPPGLHKRQIHRADLEAVKMLGQGQFGQVWLGNIKAREGSQRAGKVAVKLLRGAASAADKKEFSRECEMMLLLDHPNLVRLIGVAVQQKPWLAVLEFLSYGDIKGVLEGCEERQVEVLDGMTYMASKNLIHMDLAARNILLHTANLVKVADFGLTNFVDPDTSIYNMPTGAKLPMKWMAPESMDYRVFSEQSDVWAYGVTVWEMFSYGAMPYADMPSSELQIKVREGLRLDEPPLVPPGLYNVLLKCWKHKRLARPTFANLQDEMQKLMAQADDIDGDLGKELAEAKKKVVRKKKPKMPDWYNGTISKDVADTAILAADQGDFLVRQLPSKQSWCISVHDSKTVKNFAINMNPDNKKFEFAGMKYESLKAVIKFLKANPFQGKSGTISLAKPVKVQVQGDMPRRSSIANGKAHINRDSRSASSASRTSRKSSTGSVGSPTVSRTTSGESFREPRRGSADSNSGVTKTYDLDRDRSWLVDRIPKAVVEKSLMNGKKGQFLVRCNAKKTKYFVGIHTSKGQQPFWISIKVDDDKFSYADSLYPSIGATMKAIIGQTIKDSSGEGLTISRPGKLQVIDPKIDKSWLMPSINKGEAEAILASGQYGDFLVRAKTDKTKYFLMMHDGEMAHSITCPVKDGKVTLAKQEYKSIEDAISSIRGIPIKGSGGNSLYIVSVAKRPQRSGEEEFDGFGQGDVDSKVNNEQEHEGFEDVFDELEQGPEREDGADIEADPTIAANVKQAEAARSDQHNWFHGELKTTDAEEIVKKQDDGAFLVRKKADDEFQLLVRDSDKVATFPIKKNEDGTFSCMTVSAKSMKALIQKTARQSLQSNVSDKVLHLSKPAPGGRRYSKTS